MVFYVPKEQQFPKGDQTKNTVFDYQNDLKLVVPCRGDDYVINEWLVYKLYNLLSDKSFKARLVQVDFEDSLKRKKTETHYCILLEVISPPCFFPNFSGSPKASK